MTTIAEAENKPGTCGWAVIEDDDGFRHVVPLNDLREHSIPQCWCEPFDDDGVIVHNSADHREHFERGTRKPS